MTTKRKKPGAASAMVVTGAAVGGGLALVGVMAGAARTGVDNPVTEANQASQITADPMAATAADAGQVTMPAQGPTVVRVVVVQPDGVPATAQSTTAQPAAQPALQPPAPTAPAQPAAPQPVTQTEAS